jgi:hypothetical protein
LSGGRTGVAFTGTWTFKKASGLKKESKLIWHPNYWFLKKHIALGVIGMDADHDSNARLTYDVYVAAEDEGSFRINLDVGAQTLIRSVTVSYVVLPDFTVVRCEHD